MARILLIATALALLALAGPAAAVASAAGDPLRAVQWALDAIHLGAPEPAAPAGPAGSGALVAVIDSGVDARHPDLAGRIVAGPDFVDGDRSPDDLNGHGTHISGIIAAVAGNGIGGAGVAQNARVLAIRVLDADNEGTVAHVAAGIDAAIRARADVINLSLNWSHRAAALAPVTAAIERAANAGIAVIVASGNDAQPHCEEPVAPLRALCVGALDIDLRLAGFSSYGHGLGIVAPGEDVVSTWRGGDYAGRSGTSQSAAVVSGVAAALVGRGLHGGAVLDRLVRTARDIGSPGPDPRSGFGMLDAERALDGAAEGRVPPALRVGAARRTSQRALRAGGLRVSCDSARPGECRVRVNVGGTTVARGSGRADGTGIVKIRARLTPAGSRLLDGRRKLRGTIVASMDGVPASRVRVALAAR